LRSDRDFSYRIEWLVVRHVLAALAVAVGVEDERSPALRARRYILDRKEYGALPPLLIMQDALDDNVLPSLQEKFAASYRAADGECQLEIFEGCEHEWVAKPGPMTDKAHEMVKSFIARYLGSLRRAA
jgi:alpha-beta hydrolase superfamily lysophospholipase